MSSHHLDNGYFHKLTEQFNNYAQGHGEFSERNIQDIRDRLGRLAEEVNMERQREGNISKSTIQDNFKVFIDSTLNFMAHVLETVPPQVQRNNKLNIRIAVLDCLQKKNLQQNFNTITIEQLMLVIEKDNEINATTALKIIIEVIKHQQQNYQRPNQVVTDQNLIRLFKFLDARIEFLVKFNQELQKSDYSKLLGDPQRNCYADPNHKNHHDEKEKDLRLNIHSISFVSSIPQFYMYLVYLPEQFLREDTRTQMKEILKNSLSTMLKAVNETQFKDVLAKVPRHLTQELYGAYSKLVQFFIIVLKKETDSNNQQNKMLRELAELLRLDQIVSLVIRIVKSCPIDILNWRIELSNRLKILLQLKREPIPQSQIQERIVEIHNNCLEIIEEDTIIGSNAKLPSFQKTSLYINWLDSVKNLIVNYLPKADQNSQQPTPLEKMQSDFINNQSYMEKIFNTILKVLFDSNLHLQLHEKALELIRTLLDHFSKQDKYFIDKQILQFYSEQDKQQQQQQQNPNQQQMQNNTMDKLYKDICRSHKYKLLDRLLQMSGMKLAQLRKQLKQCKNWLIKSNKWGVIKKTTQQTTLNSIPVNREFLNDDWIVDLEKYIKDTEVDIDQNLITQQEQQATPVYSYDEEEEFQINSINIYNYQQYIEQAKEIKSKIFDQIIEIMNKLLFTFIMQTNTEIVKHSTKTKVLFYQQQQCPIMNTTNHDKKPYLSNLQCHYMSKILKNGLLIFEELHDPIRNHFEIFDYKRKSIQSFMQIFGQISDPINFKNIFEPNAKHILRISVGLNRTCYEMTCVPVLFQEPLLIPVDTNPQTKQPSKNYIEFLMHLYLTELQTTPELPTKFGYCRSNQIVSLNNQITQQKDQDEYISLIQKLIRIPIRLFPRVKQSQHDESVIKPLLKQLILFFIKKTHETHYPIDYLGLLLSLIKRIPANPSSLDQQDSLFKYFQQLCDRYKGDYRGQPQEPYHRSNLSGVNIVLNLFELFRTGIVEIQDIVAELVANLPLHKNLQISIAKQYPIFANCLYRSLHNITLNDNQVIIKTLIILENIVSSLSIDELQVFFGDLLQPFIEKLMSFPCELKMQDIINRNQNLLTDPSFKAMKILSKLGQMVRKADWPIEVKRNHNDDLFRRNQLLEVEIEGFNESVNINFTETVRCATEILSNVLENQLASYLFKQSSISYSYQIVRMVLLQYYKMPIQFKENLYKFVVPDGKSLDMKLIKMPSNNDDEFNEVINDKLLMSQVSKVFIGLSNINNIIQTITTYTQSRIKEDVEKIVTTLSEMFFIHLADQHVESALQLPNSAMQWNPEVQLIYIKGQVNKHISDGNVGIMWIGQLFRGLSKRYMLTADESLNFKDMYIQQYEFIWAQLIVGNCLKKYRSILGQQCKDRMWAANIQYSVLLGVMEELVFDKFLKQTQLQKEDDRRRKIQIMQSFGGTMIPSEGLNYRSVCIELLIELQGLRPRLNQLDMGDDVIGLPNIPDIRVYQCAFSFMKQLPETMRVISQSLICKLLTLSTQYMCDNMLHPQAEPWKDLLYGRLSEVLYLVCENTNTHKNTILQLCLDQLDQLHNQLFKGDSGRLYYMKTYQNRNQQQDPFCMYSKIQSKLTSLVYKDIPLNTFYYLDIAYGDLVVGNEWQDTVISRLAQSADKLIHSPINEGMNDENAMSYCNGYRLLAYMLQLNNQYALFRIINQQVDGCIEQYMDGYLSIGFNLIEYNEKHYGQQGRLIIQQSDEQQHQQSSGSINHQHYFDDLEYKINIEDIDFEIKWQSHMVGSIFTFFSSIATVPYLFNIQKVYQKVVEKAALDKPALLQYKFKIVETLYEGLTRVEQTIRSTAYKHLMELVLQEGPNNDKMLFENDDKLKKVMKPLLTCVQSDIFTFVPSFLKSLKLILKIFSKVFHQALADKMQNHLQKIVSETTTGPTISSTNLPPPTALEWQQQTQESLHFQMGCISGILKLFQHLTQQFSNAHHQGQPVAIKIMKIITDTNSLKRNYNQRMSALSMNAAIEKPIVKFLNTLPANHFEQFSLTYAQQSMAQLQKQLEQCVANAGQINNAQPSNVKQLCDTLREKHKWIKTIRQIISEPSAYPLREKLCREKQMLKQKMKLFESFIDELSMAVERGLCSLIGQLPQEVLQGFQFNMISQIVTVLSEIKIELVQFGYQLCKHNPMWLRKNTYYLENTVINNIRDLINKLRTNSLLQQQQHRKFGTVQVLLSYNQLTMPVHLINSLLHRYVSILKQYCAQNEDSTLAIKNMLRMITLSPQDKIRKWILHVAQTKSATFRRRIVEQWLNGCSYVDDDMTNLSQLVTGYAAVYPILYHSDKRQDLNQIADLDIFIKMKHVNDSLVNVYGKLLQEVDSQIPITFHYTLTDHQPSKFADINIYYKGIVVEMLQMSSYLVCFHSQSFNQELKISFLKFGYDMLNKADKLVAFYAKLYFSKYLKLNGLMQNDPLSVNQRFMKFYNKAIKQMDESTSGEQEINVLCRKIIAVVLPNLDQLDPNEQRLWIQHTQQILKQEHSTDQDAIAKLSRFWQMFIRNHAIFKKHQQSFTIHIINSMQQIGCHGQPGQSISTPNAVQQIFHNNQNYRRVALDMAFLQVEWQTKQIKDRLKGKDEQQASIDFREAFHQSEPRNNDEGLSSEIYQNFFIKQSLRALYVEDVELQKRALYLLKKIFIIVPLTIHKMNIDSFKKNIVTILLSLYEPNAQTTNSRIPQQPQLTPYFRYFMIVLQIITIVLEFQPHQKVATLVNQYYDIIVNFYQLPEQLQQTQQRIQQSRQQPQPLPRPNMPPTQVARQGGYAQTTTEKAQQHQQLLMIDHVQLVATCAGIFDKLIKVSRMSPSEQTETFLSNLFKWAADSVHQHSQARRHAHYPSASAMHPMAGQRPMAPIANAPKFSNLAIYVLKLFFDQDQGCIRGLIGGLRRVAETSIEYLKPKEKGDQYLENMRSHKITKPTFSFKHMEQENETEYTHSDLTSYVEDFMMLKEDFPFGPDSKELYFSDESPDQSKMKYHLYRGALLKIIKMIAYNFDEIIDWKEQQEYLILLLTILETLPDYEMKLEVITILRMLFLNIQCKEQQHSYLQKLAIHISPSRAKQVSKELTLMEEQKEFKPSKLQGKELLTFFFDLSKFQKLFDRKMDNRNSDSYDNQHQKVQDIRVMKQYFMFLVELLIIIPYKQSNGCGSISYGFYALKAAFEAEHKLNYMREFRRLLQVLSKLSNCSEYLTFFYKMMQEVFGYSYDRFLQFVLGDAMYKPYPEQDESHSKLLPTEGEEIMLMSIKMLLLGRGKLIEQTQSEQQHTSIKVDLVDENPISTMREQVLQKYIGMYQKYQVNNNRRLFDVAIKLITSEYLPSMVIYSLTSIPTQENAQQPLRECIIPYAAHELMGSAQNVSSRLLRPLFIDIMDKLCSSPDTNRCNHIIEYMLVQPISFSTQGSFIQFLNKFMLQFNTPLGIQQLNSNQQLQQAFYSFIKFLIDKNHLPTAQLLLEQFYETMSQDDTPTQLFEDINVYLAGIYHEQWDHNSIIANKILNVTQPWVKQMLLASQLREPGQQYKLIVNNSNSSFWDEIDTADNYYAQQEIEEQIIKASFIESLQNLNQWTAIKQGDVQLNKVNHIQNKLECAFREKSKENYDMNIKELTELKLSNHAQSDYIAYSQAIFKLQEFVKDENLVQTQPRGQQPVLTQIEHNLKTAQIINSYNFIKYLPKQIQSYDQLMTSPLIWGQRFLTFVSQFQLYIDLEETLRQYANNGYYSTNPYPFENYLEIITSAYTSAVNCRKYFQERHPNEMDSPGFVLDLINQRNIQMLISFQRFNSAASQFTSTQAPNIQLDPKQYHSSFIDHKNLLYQMRQHNRMGILDLWDEQSVLKDIPKMLQPICEKIIQLEHIKYNTWKMRDIDQNINNLNEVYQLFSNMPVIQYQHIRTSPEDMRALILGKVLKLKLVNQMFKALKVNESGMQIESDRVDKLETSIQATVDYFYSQQLNQFRLGRDIQRVYQIAHKKYNNNIQFAHNYILATPLAVQYKPNKQAFQLSHVFYLLNIANPNDSHVIDAFIQVWPIIPISILSQYIPQILSTYLRTTSIQLKKTCLEIINTIINLYPQLEILSEITHLVQLPDNDELLKLINKSQENNLQQQLIQLYPLGELYHKDVSTWQAIEDMVYLCGLILDTTSLELQSTNSDLNQRCLTIVNLIRNNNDKFKELLNIEKPQDIIKQLQGQKILEVNKQAIQLYLKGLTALMRLFKFDMQNTGFTNKFAHALYSPHQQQIGVTQLYNLNKILYNSPMFGMDSTPLNTETILIKALYPTITYQFTNRKRFIRIVSLLGSNEKKYTYSIKGKKSEQISINLFMQQSIGNQFNNMADIVFKNYKETVVRNITTSSRQNYIMSSNKQLYALLPIQEDCVSFGQMLDQVLVRQFIENHQLFPNNTKIPYYVALDIKSDKMNIIMDQIVPKYSLFNYISQFSKTIDTFQLIRKSVMNNMGSAFALNFLLASSQQPKQLESSIINLSNGNYYSRRVNFNAASKLYDPFAIRYSRNVEHLIGQHGMHSTLIPSITASLLAFLQSTDCYFEDYINVVYWQLGATDSAHLFIKKLNDAVIDSKQDIPLINSKCERILQLSTALFSGQEKLKLHNRRWF